MMTRQDDITKFDDAEVIEVEETMTKEERLKQIMETEEFAFIKDIPTDKLWKLIFAINFIMGNDSFAQDIKF